MASILGRMRGFAFLTILLSAIASIFFVVVLKANNLPAFLFFSLWLSAPYFLMATVLGLLPTRKATMLDVHMASIIVSVAGVVHAANAIFWNPDPQGAITVAIGPLLQGILFVMLTAVSFVLKRIFPSLSR